MSLADRAHVAAKSPGAVPTTLVANPGSGSTPRTLPGLYKLRRHRLRELYIFLVPMLVLGFYVFICCRFLQRVPSNGTVVASVGNQEAKWVFYCWIIVVIFLMDFGKTALSSIEAAALMHHKMAPYTATQLMWHTDNKWANPAWWFRAVAAFGSQSKQATGSRNQPGGLWMLLSLVMFLLVLMLPLSGLSMEFTTVSAPTSTPAVIQGPNATTFGIGSLDFPKLIRQRWQSAKTAPLDGDPSVYAPEGTEDAGTAYLYDEAAKHSSHIEFFTGPAFSKPVYGTVWGVHTNLSCLPTRMDDLQIVKVNFPDYAINQCIFNSCAEGFDLDCKLRGFQNLSDLYDGNSGCTHTVNFPGWKQQSSTSGLYSEFSLMIAVDGESQDPYYRYAPNYTPSPYLSNSSHDFATYDSKVHNRSEEEVTTAAFEIVLWEANMWNDSIINNLTSKSYPDPVQIVKHPLSAFPDYGDFVFAGMAVHCDITSRTGFAHVEPTHKTFRSFSPSASGGSVEPPQVMAWKSLLIQQNIGLMAKSDVLDVNIKDANDELWAALHLSLGMKTFTSPYFAPWVIAEESAQYHPLTPRDLQVSMYRLLGESVLVLMDRGNAAPFYGQLFELQPVSYIVRGIISWRLVLALLAIWTAFISGGAVWLAFFAGCRWASSLSGFEMFKFGAENADIVSTFAQTDFRECSASLNQISGMVGMLPGLGGPLSDRTLGFIGLSEHKAERSILYTLDRNKAAVVRPNQP